MHHSPVSFSFGRLKAAIYVRHGCERRYFTSIHRVEGSRLRPCNWRRSRCPRNVRCRVRAASDSLAVRSVSLISVMCLSCLLCSLVSSSSVSWTSEMVDISSDETPERRITARTAAWHNPSGRSSVEARPSDGISNISYRIYHLYSAIPYFKAHIDIDRIDCI